MGIDHTAVAQLLSLIIGALGTPGVTYYLMKRMSRDTLDHIRDSCAVCRAHCEDKINNIVNQLESISKRQQSLRELLPIEYVRREEFNRHINGKQ